MTDRQTRYDASGWFELEAAGLLVARLLLAAIFVHEGCSKITGYPRAVAFAEAFGIPGKLLAAAIALEICGGLAIALGLFTRRTAVAMAVFCIATAVVFHARFGDINQLLHFEKNLALACAGGGRRAVCAGSNRTRTRRVAWNLDRHARSG